MWTMAYKRSAPILFGLGARAVRPAPADLVKRMDSRPIASTSIPGSRPHISTSCDGNPSKFHRNLPEFVVPARDAPVYAVGDVAEADVPKAGMFAEGAARVVAAALIAQLWVERNPSPTLGPVPATSSSGRAASDGRT